MSSTKSSNHQKYETKNPVKGMLINNFKRSFSKMLDLSQNTSICDLGCGEGFIVNYILSQNPNIYVEGYDIEENAIQIAQELNPLASFGTVDVRDIPDNLKLKEFDYLLVMEVLEHIHEYKKVLNQLTQMNFKRLIISVPNEPFFSYGNLLFGKNVKRLGKDPDHVNFWNEESLKKLLSEYFEIEKFIKPFPWLICICKKRL